jgi:sugar phosphate isomerase/epimerase
MPELPLGAVIAFDFEKWNVQEEIALARAAGARLVQIYRNYLRGITPERIRTTLDDTGLAIDSLHGYIHLEQFDGPAFDLSSPDADVRKTSMELARAEADFARRLGCRNVIVHPVGPGHTEHDAGRSDALRRSAEKLVRIAERADVRFLVENMPPPMFGRDAKFLRDMADALESDHLGLAYDSGHATLAGRPVEIIHDMGPRLWGVHLHDNNGREDDHMLPGMGVVPFEDVARALAEVEFAGVFMLEIYRDTAEVRRDLTPERLAYINRLRRIASGL